MFRELIDIPHSMNWTKVEEINKGWSKDKKYYIETVGGEKQLLRLSDISQFDIKKRDYQILENLMDLDILMSKPLDFGVCCNDECVYMLLTWIEGDDAMDVIPKLVTEDQYKLGLKAGKSLRLMHQIPIENNGLSWSEHFNKKIDRNIRNYMSCEIKFENDHKVIEYIEENRVLLENRPVSLQHGDYHIGNMILNEAGEIGIIDFNRLDFGDPWEEFNRMTWCASASRHFATGIINGYFEGEVPNEFFKLMALYIGSNQLSSIPWAIPYGEEDVQTMLKQAAEVLESYKNFESYIPKWYLSNYKYE